MINFQNIFFSKITFSTIKKLLIILFSFDRNLIYSFYKDIPAGTEHLDFFSHIKELKVIVDIGAHKGQFALISKYIYKNAKIFSFDPLKSSKKIYKSVLKKKDGYHFFDCAIGPKNTFAKINIARSNDSSSLLDFSDKLIDIYKHAEKVSEEKIKIRRLANCLKKKNIEKPSLLKLDVQGYEIEALKGCNDLLHHFDYIYIECSFVELYKKQPLYNEIKKWLKKRKFTYVKNFNKSFDRKNNIIQADFFFKNSR
ncbi:FkbM family methyltransferase [Candidatus Pelagibacter sp.]|nr:FkbM family methyltransferase [Candidatus Pelagibacter sp.]